MNAERIGGLAWRVALHAALADPARLRIVDVLSLGDASPSELAALLDMRSNLLAHHLRALEAAGLVARRRSEGDRRRTYARLVPGALAELLPAAAPSAQRVLFVCTANSARSQLAAALWRRASAVPAASAGTHPAERINPGAAEIAQRRGLPLEQAAPARLDDVLRGGDYVVTVCDRAHEELGALPALHWSIPDPARDGTPTAFERAYDEVAARVGAFARQLRAA
jgi:protein-tyrosine-phosphatase/DNA-binding transcriptional ArsR family regulator